MDSSPSAAAMDMDRDSAALPSDGASVKWRGEPLGTVALEAGAQGPRDAPSIAGLLPPSVG
jgi:hypothetical protein